MIRCRLLSGNDHRCHKLGRKCTMPNYNSECYLCQNSNERCSFERPKGKRGAKPKLYDSEKNTGSNSKKPIFDSLTQHTILWLVGIYRKAVYPIYCFFHWSTFLNDIESKKYETDLSFYATVMSVCAISLARIRDGAIIEDTEWVTELDSRKLRDEAYLHLQGLSSELPKFDDLRTATLLMILALQDGNITRLQILLGIYLGLSASITFHDERYWPSNMNELEKQEWRALFWSTYTTDVFVAMMWKGIVRHRIDQSNVQYPDFRLDDYDYNYNNDMIRQSSWVIGWNAVTDLYRCHDRIIHPRSNNSQVDLSLVLNKYDGLPEIFKNVASLSSEYEQDIYSFQAANLSITLQAVKMCMILSGDFDVIERCHVAGELLDTLATIPTAYIKVVSAPVYHQLATVGSLLGEVVNGPLTISLYIQVRQILITYANLLASFESMLYAPAGLCNRLLQHVNKIDTFMKSEDGSTHTGFHIMVGDPQVEEPTLPQGTSGSQDNQFHITSDLRNTNNGSNLDLGLLDTSFDNVSSDCLSTSMESIFEAQNVRSKDSLFSLPDNIMEDWPLDINQEILNSWFSNIDIQAFSHVS
ncbi:uncharacterized protein L201_002371 [Kwoniella dendrophila CBS 6074]|uniref:Xylanolytic transcriptional activator regulatory domain-containing protein n=1 Tax=Kwoniella dendrophila CBS 6074 TaxID=1295534 RepID=A0AAX4JPZ9_9TREE